MARPPRWKQTPLCDGITTFELYSWKYFTDLVNGNLYTKRIVWRGQRCDDWKLESTLDRELRRRPGAQRERLAAEHLQAFKYATRGRRGPNPPHISDENEFWALGQHHGLATPLLDWAMSPYVAAYFAFIGLGKPQTNRRVVFGLSRVRVDHENGEIIKAFKDPGRPPTLEFVQPRSDENARLVSQGGLFTRVPTGTSVE